MNDKPHYVSALDVEEWATKYINLERERDEARKERDQWENDFESMKKERDEMNSSPTPETDALDSKWDSYSRPFEAIDLARKLEQERDEAMDVLSNLSHYLSCGLGDENTTPQDYGARIRGGINALTDPIVEEKEKFRKMVESQAKIIIDLFYENKTKHESRIN